MSCGETLPPRGGRRAVPCGRRRVGPGSQPLSARPVDRGRSRLRGRGSHGSPGPASLAGSLAQAGRAGADPGEGCLGQQRLAPPH